MENLFKRMEDCLVFEGGFLDTDWIRNEYKNGTVEFFLPKESGNCTVLVSVLNKITAFVVADLCFRESGRLQCKQARDRLEFFCCLQGSAWYAVPAGHKLVRLGDTVFSGALNGKQPEYDTFLFKPGERFVSAGFFLLTGEDCSDVGLLEQEAMNSVMQRMKRERPVLPEVVMIPSLQSVLYKAYCETIRNPIAKLLFLKSSALQAFSYIIDRAWGGGGGGPEILDSDEYRILQEVHDRMLEDFSHPPTLSQMAKEVGINETKLKRDFKVVYGMPIYRYFKKAKLHRAMELLRITDLSVGEVAFRCGYSSQGQFSAAFRNEFGITPLQAKKSTRPQKAGMGQKKAILGNTLRN